MCGWFERIISLDLAGTDRNWSTPCWGISPFFLSLYTLVFKISLLLIFFFHKAWVILFINFCRLISNISAIKYMNHKTCVMWCWNQCKRLCSVWKLGKCVQRVWNYFWCLDKWMGCGHDTVWWRCRLVEKCSSCDLQILKMHTIFSCHLFSRINKD